jgi:hypothetical protein
MEPNTTSSKKLEDFPKVIVEYLNSHPRWTEAEINTDYAEAKRIVEARAVADAGDGNQGPSICSSSEDSPVKQVINSISGGACFGWLTAASIGASGTDIYALTALGVALSLAITAWVWNR